MKTDDLRWRVLKIWIGGLVTCVSMFVIALVTHRANVKLADLAAPAHHLATATLPTLGALIVNYYSANLNAVSLTRGQRRLLLLLSGAYVLGFTSITYLTLFIEAFGLDQDATGQHPGVNNYGILITYVQPLIIAPLFYLFGKNSDHSPNPS
jgi:membrane-associated HD superfamily phosphohydrolase